MARLVRCSDELTVTARDELARQNAMHALALGADSGLAHAGLAVANRFARRDEEALFAFDRALELSPSDPRVLRDTAFYHLFRGRYDSALEIARKIVRTEPGLGSFIVAYALMPIGELESALAACRNALSLHPDLSLAHQLHGFIMLAKGGGGQGAGIPSAVGQAGIQSQCLRYRSNRVCVPGSGPSRGRP